MEINELFKPTCTDAGAGAAVLSETAGPLTKGQTAFPREGDPTGTRRRRGKRRDLEKNISQFTQGCSEENVKMGPQCRGLLCLLSGLPPRLSGGGLESGLAVVEFGSAQAKKNKEPKKTTASLHGRKLWRLD